VNYGKDFVLNNCFCNRIRVNNYFALPVAKQCKRGANQDPSQLKPNPKIIDFEQFTADPYTPLDNPFVIGDVTFSTRDSLYIRDITSYLANGTEVEGSFWKTYPNDLPMTITFSEPVSEVFAWMV